MAERPQPRGFDVNQPGSTLETFKGLAQGATTDLVSIPQETLATATSVASELDPRLLATSPIASALSAADPYVQDFVEKYGMQALGEMIYGKAPTEELQQIRDDARLIGGIAGLGELATLKASKGIGDFAKFLKKDPPPRIEPTINLPPGFSEGPEIISWHGTGVDFPKFSMRYVGTGEGNQMFGHGIYTSQLRVIGQGYRDSLGFRPTLSGDGETMAERALNKFEPTRIRDVEGSPFGRFIEDDDAYADLLDEIIESDDKISTRTSLTDQATVIEFKDGSALRTQNAEKIIDESGNPIFEEGVQDYLTKEPLSGNFLQPLGKSEGTLMKVGINVNPQEDLLDFYRRLSEQPTEVQRKIKKIAEKIGNKDLIKNLQNADGQGVQDAIAKYLGVQYQSPKVSELFNEFGIKGMKYSTQGTRQAKLKPEEDKYNYVIFDDSVLKILKKYGIAGPVTLTAARGAVSEPEEKQMKKGGIVTLADVARNTGRGPLGVASLSSTARNMNGFQEGGEVPPAKNPLSDRYAFELTGPSPEAVDQARRLALIEMQMDPGAREVFDNNPYARLGLDILERGEFPDRETADFGAKLTAAVIGESDAIPSNLRGKFVPSYALGSDALGEDVKISGLGERVRQVLSDQGVTDPQMSRKEGSTAYYLAGGLPDEDFFTGGRARTLQVIAHELGHLGYMALQRKMREETGRTTYYQDEDTLDLKDYESSKRLGIIPGSDDVRAYKLITDDRELVPGVTVGEYNRDLLREQERDAYELMRQRGMPMIEQGPPEPPPPEPEKGIGAKFLELIGVQ